MRPQVRCFAGAERSVHEGRRTGYPPPGPAQAEHFARENQRDFLAPPDDYRCETLYARGSAVTSVGLGVGYIICPRAGWRAGGLAGAHDQK